jgi:hypothetical protein
MDTNDDLNSMVWAALRATWTSAVPGCCIVNNERLRKLDRSVDLIFAIEEVVTSREFSTAYQVERRVRRNTHELLKIYFRTSQEHEHDVLPFVESTQGEVRGAALRAVFTTWGPGGYDRLKSIPKPLFNYFCAAMGADSRWSEVFTRYQRIGILEIVT